MTPQPGRAVASRGAARCSDQWTGGTGKYRGIKGNNKFYGVTIAPTASGYSSWEGSWELP